MSDEPEVVSDEQEAEEQAQFFEERGIPVDREHPERTRDATKKARAAIAEARGEDPDADGDSDEGDEPPSKPDRNSRMRRARQAADQAEPDAGDAGDAGEAVTAAELSDQELDQLEQFLTQPAEHPAERRIREREERETERLRGELERQSAILAAVVRNLRGEGQPAEQPAGEAEPDWMAEPDQAFEQAAKPMRDEITRLSSELETQKRKQFIAQLRADEAQYDAQGDPSKGIPPGYLYRLERANAIKKREWLGLGISEEKVDEMLKGRAIGAVRAAQELGIPPWLLVDNESINLLRANGIPLQRGAVRPGAQSGPAAKKPGKRNGSIAAARAAVESAAGTTLGSRSTQGRPPMDDVEALLRSGVTPEHINEAFERGGRRGFLDFMERLEGAAQRED